MAVPQLTRRQRVVSFGLPIAALALLMVLSTMLRSRIAPDHIVLFYTLELVVVGPVIYAIGALIKHQRSVGWTIASLIAQSVLIIVIFANVYVASGLETGGHDEALCFCRRTVLHTSVW